MWEPQETRIRSLGREDPMEKGMATNSSILAWRIPMGRGAWRATVQGVTKSRAHLRDYARTHHLLEFVAGWLTAMAPWKSDGGTMR